VNPWRGWAEVRRIVRPRPQLDHDVDAELAFHIEGRIDELESEGWSRDEARAEVLRHFGQLERVASECRQLSEDRITRERRVESMGVILQDVRYTFRTLKRYPGFALVAVLTLALGIGATTAIFSLVDGVVLRPLPFHAPDRLVMIWEQQLAQDILSDNPSPPNFQDWKRENRSFTGMAAWLDGSMTLSSLDPPEVVTVAYVSWDLLPLVGVEPIVGRSFTSVEGITGGPNVALISHRLWQRAFEGRSDVLGRALVLNDVGMEVVGVMPPTFDIPRPGTDVWLPSDWSHPDHHRQTRNLTVMGRLLPEVSIEEAEADMNRVAAGIAQLHPESNEGWTVDLVSAHEQTLGDAPKMLMIIFGAVGFVLLISCANVANLMLGRAAYRSQEIAVRVAIGANRRRIVQQLLTESLVIGLLGGALGVLIAFQGVRLFLALEPGDLPRAAEVGVDLRVLLFALATSVLTGVLFGLSPAMDASRRQAGEALREGRARGGSGRRSVRRLLVAGEVAISMVLLVGAGLLSRSFMELRAVDPGFDPEGVILGAVNLSATAYPQNEDRIRYFETVLDRLSETPGVQAVGVTTTLPMDPAGIDFDLPYWVEGQPAVAEGDMPQTDYRIVSPGYFDAMGMTIVRGRGFTRFDRREGERVLVISETFAERLWPGQDPIGRSITVFYVNNVPWEVVGVVGDTRHAGLSVAPRAQMFVPLAQAEYVFGYLTVVARGAPGVSVADGVRMTVAAVDPKFPLYRLMTLEGRMAETIARDRFTAGLFGIFALLALLLAAAGIHGVVAYQVARQTHEIGLRLALGAGRRSVLTKVVREALTMASLGVVVGITVSVALSRLLSGLLYGVSPLDPTTYGSVAAVLLLAAAGSAAVPALRAAGVDPVDALRAE